MIRKAPTPYTEIVARFKDTRVALIGGGIEGQAMASFVSEMKPAELVLLDRQNVELHDSVLASLPRETGPAYLDSLGSFDIAVRSPGVPYLTPAIQKAQASGTVITSMTKLFFELCPAPIIAVTGSNGKTTTTNLTAHLLKQGSRKVWRGGNDAEPLFNRMKEITVDDLVVLELSSFQLQDLDKSPHIAVITNITPNHLDAHKTFEEYVEAKRQIIAHQTPDDIAILSSADPVLKTMKTVARTFYVQPDGTFLPIPDGATSMDVILPSDAMPFVTAPSNVGTAILIAELLGITPEQICAGLKSFTLPEQRLEVVGVVNDVTFVNDSSCTTPESAIVGLRAFPMSSVVLIAGGRNKGMSFDALGKEIVARKAQVVLIGESAPHIAESIQKARAAYPIAYADTLSEAIEKARSLASALGYVLLSPACASFDMFQNAKERGRKFSELVKQLA